MFIAVFNSVEIFGQQSVKEIYRTIDSLNNLINDNPLKSDYRKSLIEYYSQNSMNENALVEIINAEYSGVPTEKIRGIKNYILFWLGGSNFSLTGLINQYLEDPESELNYYLPIALWSRGSQKESLLLLKSLDNDSGVLMKLALLYKQLHAAGLNKLASSSIELIKKYDYREYAKLFPVPTINVLSPSRETFTSADSFRVVFTVQHTAQVKDVFLNGEIIFKNNPQNERNNIFNKKFDKMLALNPGKNSIKISVDDYWGINAEENFVIWNYNFSPVRDLSVRNALNKEFEIFHNFINNELIENNKRQFERNLIISYPDSYFFEDVKFSEFWSKLLSDSFSGGADLSHIQSLASENASSININLLFDKWLFLHLNVQTDVNLILNTEYEIKDGEIFAITTDGKVNLSQLLERNKNKYFNSLRVIFFTKDDSLISEMQKLNYSGLFNTNLKSEIICYRIDEELQSIVTKFLSPANSLFSPASTFWVNDPNKIVIYENGSVNKLISSPGMKIQQLKKDSQTQLNKKISNLKINKKKSALIKRYSSDWRNVSVVIKFIKGRILYSEFMVYVNEYNQRGGNNGNE